MVGQMQGFAGFPTTDVPHTRIPAAFFSELLPIIDDLAELKVTTYCFWALSQREGEYRYIRRQDMLEDELLLRGLGDSPEAATRKLIDGLERATARGTLLHIVLTRASGDDHLYFMNGENGRAAVSALEQGNWTPGIAADQPIALINVRPTLFAIYEQNIGALTPIVADKLKADAQEYPMEWIIEAIEIAVAKNARSLTYVEAVLKRMMIEGKKNELIRQDSKGDRSSPYSSYEQLWDND